MTVLNATTRSITIAKIQVNGADRHYALVASLTDSGVQMIDITDSLNAVCRSQRD